MPSSDQIFKSNQNQTGGRPGVSPIFQVENENTAVPSSLGIDRRVIRWQSQANCWPPDGGRTGPAAGTQAPGPARMRPRPAGAQGDAAADSPCALRPDGTAAGLGGVHLSKTFSLLKDMGVAAITGAGTRARAQNRGHDTHEPPVKVCPGLPGRTPSLCPETSLGWTRGS